MDLIAIFIALLLTAISLLHVYWGTGGAWPGSDAASCAKAVIGSAGVDKMPGPVACFGVALVIFATALLALAQAGLVVTPFPAGLIRLAMLGVMLVFILRGIAGFIPRLRRFAPEEPFARLDRQYYSPLCLMLGGGFALLLSFANPA